jgi:hypothetical protein
VDDGTRIAIDVHDAADSFFIVLRDRLTGPSVLDVTKDGESVPPADLHLFYDDNDRLTAESAGAGTYTLAMSDGTKHAVTIDRDSQAFAIQGAWQTQKQDEKGYAVLKETTFETPRGFGEGRRVFLDLGSVYVMAGVTLNGRAYDTLWMPPFTLDVTDALRPGRNTLEVLVTSTSTGQPALGEVIQLRAITRKAVR